MRTTDNIFTFLRTENIAGQNPSVYNPITKGIMDTKDPMGEVICKTIFKKYMVSLTLEIGKSVIMETVKDVKVTFPDMLGTIGASQT